jgi:hypothetical protein
MIGSEDMTVREVLAPIGNLCHSGHTAPEEFKRNGVDVEPTRFFEVRAKNNPSVIGVYCEPCLIIANHMAQQKKKNGKI